MRLVEQGKLRQDDLIVKYLPRSPRKWRGITVRHLLTHTSGVIGHLDDGLFLALGEKTDVTTEEDFGAIAKDPVGFAPGQRFQYSDAGYFLLGMVIEKASGHSYRDFMVEQLFRPLGMTSTSINRSMDRGEASRRRTHTPRRSGQ
jgi:D-alanyl-D-alanine carboxypeptidase